MFVRRCLGIIPKIIRFNVPRTIPQNFIRTKHSLTSGVKGNRSRNSKIENNEEEGEINSEINLEDDNEYDYLVNNAMHVTRKMLNYHNVLVIQPYVKWGPKKTITKPELLLQESEALVKSLPKWTVEHSIKVPLESLDKRSVFGSGKLEELKTMVKQMKASGKLITCIFISKGTLTGQQKRNLEQHFGIPVMDRYSIVIQILRLHATSTEAKLQVAMAEIPYIWSQLRDSDVVTDKRTAFSLTDNQKQLLRNREKKLKSELAAVRTHRELLRNRRKQKNYPIVAVVGYTNAGKTSLIKALTDEDSLQPRNQLFATLDVTAHAGFLPCNLEVIYMDTVGFMSDIPTGLLECFIATLEDAMLADVIIHVQDISHENHLEQKKHVENTLKSLLATYNQSEDVLKNVINIGNKSDLIENPVTDLKLVSSKNLTGINELLVDVEKRILESTNRIKMSIKVPNGGLEMSWLYKNSAVTECVVNEEDSQQILLNVVISNGTLEKFKHEFLGKRK